MAEDRKREEDPPRKAPRLDPQVSAAAAADSGRSEALPTPAAVSNLKEEGAEGTSGDKQCDHVPTEYMKILRPQFLLSERAGRCELCERPFYGSSILVCLVCGRCFCTGVGSVEYPFGHSRVHAQQEGHWVAALSEDPVSAFCFKCDCVMDLPRDAIRGLVAAAKSGSGSDDTSWPEPEGPNDDEPCNHVPTDRAHVEMLRLSLISERAGLCEHCKTFNDSSIFVCTECGLHFCSGFGTNDCPSGHARMHARQKQHWVAASFDEPEDGYCFKCGYFVCVSVPPDDAEVMDQIDAEFSNEPHHALGLTYVPDAVVRGLLKLGDTTNVHDYAVRGMPKLGNTTYVRDYPVRGMPNLGNTCYLNALVQCFFVLDKLRVRMLGPDVPESLVAITLKELFVETSTAGGMLDPAKFLMAVRLYDRTFQVPCTHDSQELFISLCRHFDEAEEEMGRNGPDTVMHSVFGFEMSATITCTCSLIHSIPPEFHCGLSMGLPLKVQAESAAPSQTSPSLKSQLVLDLQLCPPNEQGKSEKIETVAECRDSHSSGSELKDVVVKETPEPLEVDSTDVQRIYQKKDAVQGTLQAQEDKISGRDLSKGLHEVLLKSVGLLPKNVSDAKFEGMNETTADSIAAIEECLSLFCEDVTDWRCDNCKGYKELNSDRSKNGEQSSVAQDQILRTVDKFCEETNLGTSFGEKDSAACKTPKEPECHAGNLETESSCPPTEKQANLLRAQHNQDVSVEVKMYQDSRKQIDLDHRACQLKNDGSEQQRDRNGDAIRTYRFNKLPPVFILHLKRFNNFREKISGHVRYKEYLDVGPFMNPSSVDKDNSMYRLVGVVEHRGTKSLETGHVVAYVRARKLGNVQKQGSRSHSWLCANDKVISEVSLEDVLKREAYILFYERVEGTSSHKDSEQQSHSNQQVCTGD